MKNLKDAQELDDFIGAHSNAVVDFYADWCGPCKALHPELEKLELKSSGEISVMKINVDQQPDLAKAFDVRSIPTLIYYKDGVRIHRQTGSTTAASMQDVFKIN